MKRKDQPEQPRISVRIPKDSDLKQRLVAAIEKTGMDEPTLVLRCVEAAVDYIEAHGSITLPLVVHPRTDADPSGKIVALKSELRAAEPPGKYRAKRKRA